MRQLWPARQRARSAWPEGMGRWRPSPAWPRRATDPSCASPSGPGTISRATSASTSKTPSAALAAFDGEERRVDIGRGGDRWFVNNISLGLYASFVHDPARKTRNRLVALLRMVPAAFGRSRTPLDLSLEVEGRREHRSALVVLVASNGYAMRSMSDLGQREHLDEGMLHAYVIEAVSGRALLGLFGRVVAGRLERAEGWSEW